jgi:hypothetical protein
MGLGHEKLDVDHTYGTGQFDFDFDPDSDFDETKSQQTDAPDAHSSRR